LRKSLSELATALNAIRGQLRRARALDALEKEFAAALARHDLELSHSRGARGSRLVREDFRDSVRLRRVIADFDAMNVPARRSFVEAGATLTGRCAESSAGTGAARPAGRGGARGRIGRTRRALVDDDRYRRDLRPVARIFASVR